MIVDPAQKLLMNGMDIDQIGHQLTPHCRPRCLTFLTEAQRDNLVWQLTLSQNEKKKKKEEKRGGGVGR